MTIDKAYLPQVGDQQPAPSRNADHGQVGGVWEPVPHRLHLTHSALHNVFLSCFVGSFIIG